MWALHFEVLSQKQANSYRKSLMFKTCYEGGLTKVSTCGLPQDEPKMASQEFLPRSDGAYIQQTSNKQNSGQIYTWVMVRTVQKRVQENTATDKLERWACLVLMVKQQQQNPDSAA